MVRFWLIVAIALWLMATVAVNVAFTDLTPASPPFDALADAFA